MLHSGCVQMRQVVLITNAKNASKIGKMVTWVKRQFSCLEKWLKCIHYPTINRLPRALRYYTTWKTNEFRITLLFGYKYV